MVGLPKFGGFVADDNSQNRCKNERTTTMKDIDIVASMFEEIKKSLEKLSKQKPSSQPTAETLSEDIISLKKILKLNF